jgi:hypothetical protein
MKAIMLVLGIILLSAAGIAAWHLRVERAPEVRFSDTEKEFEETEDEHEESEDAGILPEISPVAPPAQARSPFVGWGRYWVDFSPEEERLYGNWKRPEGPMRVGLQVGHWKNDEAPDELSGLRRSGNGAVGGGKTEMETVLKIAELTKALLEQEGIRVDLLPATVPVDYIADAFVSIHADGNNNSSVSGFKISGPRRDFSERANELVRVLYESYGRATGMSRDPSVSRRMSGYYAFNWRRYDHAVHPMTPAVIVETGFMTSARDRAVIVAAPERAARGIAEGILAYLRVER